MHKCPLESICDKGNLCCIDCEEKCDKECNENYGFCPDRPGQSGDKHNVGQDH